MDSQQEPSASVDPKAAVVWAEYAKDRFEAAEKRLSDFRGWARQLGAAIAVVIGLEAALLTTPTLGRLETKAAEPSREKMVATPTPGPRITVGTNKPR